MLTLPVLPQSIAEDELLEALQFIHGQRTQGQNVLVHCAQGKSRSSTIVLAYLMALDAQLSPAAALAQVQEKRSVCTPHPRAHAACHQRRFCCAAHTPRPTTHRRMAQPNAGFMAALTALHARGWFAEAKANLLPC